MNIKHVVALCFLHAGSTAYAADIDVSGVKLGMPADQAKKVIVAANNTYRINDIKSPNGSLIGANGLVTGFQNSITEHFQALYDPEGKVWFVGRAQTVPRGSSFTMAQIRASLVEKYGAPSFSSDLGTVGSAQWQYNRAGVLFKGAHDKSPCKTGQMDGSQVGLSVAGFAVKYPTKLDPNCGRVVEASMMSDPQTGLVSVYVVRAYESAETFDANQRNAQAAREKRQNAIDGEIRANNKPRL